MVYLQKILLPKKQPDWPLNIPSLTAQTEIGFSSSVTVFVGENGSGKSTLLEALAKKLALPAIGEKDAGRDPTLEGLAPLSDGMKTIFSVKQRIGFFLRAEDFFAHTKHISSLQKDLRSELERVDAENKYRSRFAQGQARMAYASSLYALESDYTDNPDAFSHGESFLRLFSQRIHDGGLYILDEPEAPLSFSRQLALVKIIMDHEENSQFLIATHSPILAAYPDAVIYSLDGGCIKETQYDELENINLLKDFLHMPKVYMNALKRQE